MCEKIYKMEMQTVSEDLIPTFEEIITSGMTGPSPTNLDYYTNLPKKEIPAFIQALISNVNFAEDVKWYFVLKAMPNYLSKPEVRERADGKMLVFYKNVFLGIFLDHKYAPIPEGACGSDIGGVEIMMDPAGYLLVHQVIIDIGSNLRPNLAKTEITSFCNETEYIQELKLIDTGASYTTIPNPNKWNCRTQKYNITNMGRRTNPLEILNDNIDEVVNLILETGNGTNNFQIVKWKVPLKISIGTLPQVNVRRMIAPNDETQKDVNVLGFDIISKHTIVISSRNNKVDMLITAGESLEYEAEGIMKITDKSPGQTIFNGTLFG